MAFGLFNNHGALAGYFNQSLSALAQGDPSIKRHIQSTSTYWQSYEDQLDERISFLQSCAKKVSEPILAKGWHEYRSSIGGKIESWVSNTLNQDEEIRRQLFGYEGENGSFEAVVKQTLLDVTQDVTLGENGVAVVSESSKTIARDCLAIIGDDCSRSPSDERLFLLRKLIGGLRVRLGEEYQIAFRELQGTNEKEREKEAKEKRAYKKYPVIFKDIRLVPNFLGETKKKAYEKFVGSAALLKEGIAFLASIDEQVLRATPSPRFESDAELLEFALKQC